MHNADASFSICPSSYLLDAINVVEPDITRILSPHHHDGINAHVTPPEPRADIDNNVGITSRTPHAPSESPHMNGNPIARHTNGNRHRPIKVTCSAHLSLKYIDFLNIARRT